MSCLAIKRYTQEARELRSKPQRYQRRFPTQDAAIAAAERWFADTDVKAVWVYDGDDVVLHKNLTTHPRETT